MIQVGNMVQEKATGKEGRVMADVQKHVPQSVRGEWEPFYMVSFSPDDVRLVAERDLWGLAPAHP